VARLFSGQKKPPCRRYKEEYGDSCFYHGQPEPPADLNPIKNRRDSKRERVKNGFSCSVTSPPLPARRCLRPDAPNFARKKPAIFLSGLNNQFSFTVYGKRAAPAGERHTLSMEKKDRSASRKRPGIKKKLRQGRRSRNIVHIRVVMFMGLQ